MARYLRCSLLLVAFAVSVFPTGRAYALEELFQSEQLVVAGEEHLLRDAEFLVQNHPKVKSEIEHTIGLTLTSRPKVLLIDNEPFFQKLSSSPFFSAFAVPTAHLIVVHISPRTSRPATLHDMYKHELCHLVLHEHIRGENLPKWLDEGICQWVSGTLGEFLAGDGVMLTRIEMARRLIPLEQLTVTFPKNKELLLLAYKQSDDFVGYVTARYGNESLRQILKLLKDGYDIEQAMLNVLSKPLKDVQEDWAEDMGRGSGWLVWMSQHLYEILFFAAAMLTVVAVIRLRLMRGKYVDEEEEDTDLR